MRRRTRLPTIVLAFVAWTMLVVPTTVWAQQEMENRWAGGDRFATAVAISEAAWQPGDAEVAFLASGDAFADAVALGASTRGRGPILLVQRDQLPPVVAQEITRLDVCEAVAVGGTAVIEHSVLNAAETLASENCPEQPPRAPEPVPVTDYSVVYPDHWGPIRFGETVTQAQAAGADVRFDEATQDEFWDDYGCGYADLFDGGARIGDVLVEKGPEGPVLGAVSHGDNGLPGGRSVTPTVGGVLVGMTESDLMGIAEAQGWVPHLTVAPHGIFPEGRTITYSPPESPPHALGFNIFPDEDGTPVVFGYAAGLDVPVQASLEEGCL